MSALRYLPLSVFLVVLAWGLSGVLSPLREEGPPYTNEDGKVFINHSSIFAPSTREGIVEVVRNAYLSGRRVRVVGTGHSWSPVSQSQDITLSLWRYRGVVGINREKMEVTVRGGTRLSQLNEYLDKEGLAMINLGSISDQTIAGSIATATHGTGITYGNLATLVTGMELVSGKGELHVLTQDSGDVFKAAQVSVGMLGVVTEVTIRVTERFNLEETTSVTTIEGFLSNLEGSVGGSDHVKVWLELYSGLCQVFEANRSMEEQPRDNPNTLIENIKVTLYSSYIRVISLVPFIVPQAMKAIIKYGGVFNSHNRVDVSYRVFNIPFLVPTHSEAELVVAYEHTAAALRDLRRHVVENSVPVNFIVEVRFVEADDIWLSPEYGMKTTRFTLCIYSPWDGVADNYFNGAFEALKKYNARFHWGKQFHVSPDCVWELFPRFEDFARVRQLMDPKGVFLNYFLKDSLGF